MICIIFLSESEICILQNSWTKQAVEADSSQAVSPMNQLLECPDSTCAQVIRSNADTAANKNAQINAKRKCQEEEDHPGNYCY